MTSGGEVSGNYVDPLNGKRIAILGSSTADVNFGEKNFWEYIQERTGCVILNFANAGSRLVGGSAATNQLQRIDDLPTSEIDLIVWQPGLNDDVGSVPLGTFESSSNADFYGSLHIGFQKLYDKFPIIPIGALTGQYSGTRDEKESPYHDAIVEVANYYSVPAVNLKKEGGTPYTYQPWRSAYTPDNTHLKADGGIVLSYRVQSFVRQLIGY